jgi:hypothetical protein
MILAAACPLNHQVCGYFTLPLWCLLLSHYPSALFLVFSASGQFSDNSSVDYRNNSEFSHHVMFSFFGLDWFQSIFPKPWEYARQGI